MSNSLLQEFEPLDRLAEKIAPRSGRSVWDVTNSICDGVFANVVRFSQDGGSPIYYRESEFAERRPAHRRQSQNAHSAFPSIPVGRFDPRSLGSRPRQVSGWHDETPRDRFREAASSDGTIRIETLSALAFLETDGFAVASVREALAPTTPKEPRAGSKPGRKPLLPWDDMVDDLVAEMQDPERGRLSSGDAEKWAIKWASEYRVHADRSTVQPYVKRAFERYDRWAERLGKNAGN